MVDAFIWLDRSFPLFFCVGCSSAKVRFREEDEDEDDDVACCGENPSLDPDSRLAAFAAPLVTRRVREPVLVTRPSLDETETLVLAGHVKGSTTVMGPVLINRVSIFDMSKSREEAGVSVPCRVSDSVDASL